jgi:hypothetical protein
MINRRRRRAINLDIIELEVEIEGHRAEAVRNWTIAGAFNKERTIKDNWSFQDPSMSMRVSACEAMANKEVKQFKQKRALVKQLKYHL